MRSQLFWTQTRASLMLVVSVISFAIAGPVSIGIAIIARQRFGTPLAFGRLMSALAAGGLTGTILAGVGKHRRRGRLLLLVNTFIGSYGAGCNSDRRLASTGSRD
jgi:hypothetical protein